MDPLGLVSWTGTAVLEPQGHLIMKVNAEFELVSECVDNTKVTVRLGGDGFAANVGMMWTSAMQIYLELEDPFAFPSSINLSATGRNTFNIVQAGVNPILPVGISFNSSRIGQAQGTNWIGIVYGGVANISLDVFGKTWILDENEEFCCSD